VTPRTCRRWSRRVPSHKVADIHVRRERTEFGKLLVAQGASTLGSQFALVALPLATFELTGSAAAAGLVGVANGLSRTLAGLFPGPVADRFNQVRLMVACDIGRLLIALTFAWVFFTEATTSVLLLAALVSVEGVLSTLFYPSETIVVCRVVAPERLSSRLARSETVTWTAAVIGPPLGGALFAVTTSLPFIVHAAAYVLSTAFVLSLRRESKRPGKEREVEAPFSVSAMLAGFRYIVADRFLRPVVAQIALHNVALGALSLIVTVGAYRRGVPGALVGAMVGAQAVGALVGSFAMQPVSRRLTAGNVVLATGALWVILVPLIAVLTEPMAIIVLLGCLWLLAPIQRTVLGTYRGQRVPALLLGRVTAASMLLTGSLAALGPWLGGVLLEAHSAAITALVLFAVTAPPVLVSRFVCRIGTTRVDMDSG